MQTRLQTKDILAFAAAGCFVLAAAIVMLLYVTGDDPHHGIRALFLLGLAVFWLIFGQFNVVHRQIKTLELKLSDGERADK